MTTAVEGEGSARARPPGAAVAVARGRIEDDASADYGAPATVVYASFANPDARPLTQGAVWTVGATGVDATYQVRVVAVRKSGRVHDIWLSSSGGDPGRQTEQTLLHLSGEEATRFVALLGNAAFMSVLGDRLPDPDAAVAVAGAPELEAAYRRDPAMFRQLIESDVAARDVVAVAHRRRTVEAFRLLLDDTQHFADQAAAVGGKERVWQVFFEANPWLLGGSLAGTLFTAWDPERLEQTVVGRSISSVGKRPDALLRSAGLVRSMALVELKHQDTQLLAPSAYRSGTWAVSAELAGAVAQAQMTVQLFVEQMRGRLQEVDVEGFDLPGEFTYLVRPRSFVVAGRLDQLVGGSGGDHQAKIRSFELFRRNLASPEVLTFDEVLARADAMVADTSGSARPGDDG
jgi:hypothetical protein